VSHPPATPNPLGQELSFRSLARFQTVVGLALGGALCIYSAVAVCGYLAFGSGTLGNVLENFAADYPLAIAARAALLVILCAVFPKA
jgi:amino acid permease